MVSDQKADFFRLSHFFFPCVAIGFCRNSMLLGFVPCCRHCCFLRCRNSLLSPLLSRGCWNSVAVFFFSLLGCCDLPSWWEMMITCRLLLHNHLLLLLNTNTPFYLGSGDYSGDFITPTRLKLNYYDDWTTEIKMALEAHRKFGFLDGIITVAIPPYTTTDWVTVNAMLISWTTNTINPNLLFLSFVMLIVFELT